MRHSAEKGHGTDDFLKGYVLAFLLLFLNVSGFGQVTINYSKAADCIFNSLSDINTGCDVSDYLTLQFNGFTKGVTIPAGWSLNVRANGNFSNGSTVIPAQTVSIRFDSDSRGHTGVTGTGYQALKFTDVKLINTSAPIDPPPTFFDQRFDISIQGGSQLTAGSGRYMTTLTVSLVNNYGVTIASRSDVPVSFTVNYSNTCSGAVLNSYTGKQYSFLNYAQEMAGTTVTDGVTIQYTPNSATCAGWSLKVRAAGSFTNGANVVAPQYFSMRFNRVSVGVPSAVAIGVKTDQVALSTADVTLINQSNAPFVLNTFTEHKFDMIIQGGNHLILPNGVYTGNLIFTLYNQLNQVVSTSTAAFSFAIYSTSNSYTVLLQNFSSDVNMVFNTPADYINGVSVSKINGLRVIGYSPYQMIVKTGSANLISGSTADVIPVSAVNLEIRKNTATAGGIVCYTRALSTADQIMISNPLSDYTQQNVEYNLRYFTLPGDSRLRKSGGVFNTVVFFIATPQ